VRKTSVFLASAIALGAFCLATQASAEVMHYSKCKLEEGKTIPDVQAWVDGWRTLVKEKGIDYRVRILLPHADNDLGADEFFIEGGSSTLETYAAAWSWWYNDAEAAKSADQLNAAASCDSGAVYRSTD
jgi:hypothetical protein